jgi:antibiotic biosynthesis monooxygenase (ABM) superfamily enzyme
MIALDLAHSVLMRGMVPDIGAHLAVVAPTYVVVPIITTLTMGYLERRSLKPRS